MNNSLRRSIVSVVALITFVISALIFSSHPESAAGLVSPLPTPTHIPNAIRGLSLPSAVRQREIAIAQGVSANPLPWNRTSDYMLGTVTVAIILPQCVGSGCTESWTTSEINQVDSEVRTALQWWQQKAAAAGATVQFQVVSGHPITVPVNGVEPINVPGGNSLELCGDEGRWITPVMTGLGFDQYPSSGVGYLDNVRDYDNYLRQTYHTGWAFVAFVADASNDAINDPVDGDAGKGLFRRTTCGGTVLPFGVSGYAWIAGPHMVMNNVNDGFGSIFMDGVAAMEIGHVFGAPDELYAPGYCTPPSEGYSCDHPWGYLNVPSGNCAYIQQSPGQQTCMINDTLSIMRSPVDNETGVNYSTVNIYTYSHVGWKDSNSNGIPDPIDTTPIITLNPYAPDPTSTRAPTYIGVAEDVPLHTTNSNYADVSINHVRVEYRINNGPWYSATSADGAFDSYYEAYTFAPLLCQNGTYQIDARAINSVDHISSIASDTLTVASSTPCSKTYLPIMMKSYQSGMALANPAPATAQPSLFNSPLATPNPSGTSSSLPMP
jgi:hypothetical protein